MTLIIFNPSFLRLVVYGWYHHIPRTVCFVFSPCRRFTPKTCCRFFTPRYIINNWNKNNRRSRVRITSSLGELVEEKDGSKDKKHQEFKMNGSDSEVEEIVEGARGGEANEEIETDEVQVIKDNNEENVDFTVSEVLIELDDNLKNKLVADLVCICDVDPANARFTLEAHNWNMQNSIDMLLENDGSEDGDIDDDIQDITPACGVRSAGIRVPPPNSQRTEIVSVPSSARQQGSSSSASRIQLSEIYSPESDVKKEKETEIERLSTTDGPGFTNWAPEKLSVISWNLDGLDDKNLEKRCDYVVSLIEREKHDVVFFQELLPFTFDYIGRRLISTYKPILGTDDPSCEYLTATFLRNNSVHYEDHYIIPYPNTAMGRNLLVTKAFVGRVKLALLNTHLESTAEFSGERTVQLKSCFEICQSFDSEYNVIFGGDLNLRDKEVGGNLPTNMCDLWIQNGSRPSCQYTWDLTRNTNKQMPSKYQPRCRFDRLYFRRSSHQDIAPEFFGVTGIEKVPNTQSFPSDHWAIISFFALSKEARKPLPKKRKAEGESSP